MDSVRLFFLKDCLEWHPEEKNVIRIVDKSSGEEVGAEYRVRYTTGLANIKHLQSTTRITEFLVVDKSSVILVKRPKFR